VVIENKINIEVVAVYGNTLLAGDESEALTEFEEEIAEAIDETLLEVFFLEVGVWPSAEEFKDVMVLYKISWRRNLLAFNRKLQNLLFVTAKSQSFE